VVKAMRLRARCNVPPESAIDPVDLAAKIGIQVHFEPLPSLEGFYVAGRRPRIILGSDRPGGRRNFTCAHELGHDAHGHGTHVDEYRPEKKSYDPEEFAADRFAAALLMPKIAVEAAFANRGWNVRNPTAEQVFIVAPELGVGYSTLAGYLSGTLKLISGACAKRLRARRPQELKAALADRSIQHHLIVVDVGWRRPQLNLDVGDVVMFLAVTFASDQARTGAIWSSQRSYRGKAGFARRIAVAAFASRRDATKVLPITAIWAHLRRRNRKLWRESH
jgi:hypothetical protein